MFYGLVIEMVVPSRLHTVDLTFKSTPGGCSWLQARVRKRLHAHVSYHSPVWPPLSLGADCTVAVALEWLLLEVSLGRVCVCACVYVYVYVYVHVYVYVCVYVCVYVYVCMYM